MTHFYPPKPIAIKHLIILFSLFVFMLISPLAYAKGNYHVEVIVFKQLDSTTVGSRPPEFTNVPNFSNTWQSKNIYLNTFAAKMRSSRRYEVLTHSSWGQKSASYNESAAKSLTVAGINGFIKVFATQLLLADIKLNFEGHTISERRRLKLNEIHYFDNVSFGVLMRVSRI